MNVRVIPCLLLRSGGLIKTVRFKDEKYVGDPLNAVRIFNEKEVDELCFLDVTATVEKRKPDIEFIREIAGECFMPFSYGGGISSLADIEAIFAAGVEKVVINNAAFDQRDMVRQAVKIYGSQSIVVAMDVRKSMFGRYSIVTHRATHDRKIDPVQHAREMEDLGVGELFLNSVDRDGTGQGYDIELVKRVAPAVSIPVIASGGAGKLEDFSSAVKAGASAVAAGSFFVFFGKHRAVLITYPVQAELQSLFDECMVR